MWIFGGVDDSSDPLPVGNELLCFDPSTQAWSITRCTGDIPHPQQNASSAVLDNTVWLLLVEIAFTAIMTFIN